MIIIVEVKLKNCTIMIKDILNVRMTGNKLKKTKIHPITQLYSGTDIKPLSFKALDKSALKQRYALQVQEKHRLQDNVGQL